MNASRKNMRRDGEGVSTRHCEPTGRANARPMTGSASADPGPITTGGKDGAKAVDLSAEALAKAEQHLSKQPPRRMGPGVRRDDVGGHVSHPPVKNPVLSRQHACGAHRLDRKVTGERHRALEVVDPAVTLCGALHPRHARAAQFYVA